MRDRIRTLIIIALISLIPTFLIWMPFFFRLKSLWNIPLPQAGMATIVANYDGPLFLVVAKTLYNPELIKQNFAFPLPTEYYAAHFPLYPLLVKFFAWVMGYPYAMLSVTVLTSVLALIFFYKFILQYVDEKYALWMTFVFAIFPARWLIVRSVGSAEPLFIAATVASIYYFQQKKYWLAGIWGVVAQLTKSPGILLFITYFLALSVPNMKIAAIDSVGKWIKSLNLENAYPIFLIPMSLVALFVFYAFRFNDFFAYFHSGDNIHIFFPPFTIFNYSQPWVGTFWLEEIIFVYLLALLGLVKLIRQKHSILAWFVAVYFFSIIFVSHRDLIRYSLPIVPLLLVAFSETINKKEFRIVMAILFIPIYLFSLAYISQNVMPISDWTPFL